LFSYLYVEQLPTSLCSGWKSARFRRSTSSLSSLRTY